MQKAFLSGHQGLAKILPEGGPVPRLLTHYIILGAVGASS